MPSIKQQYGVLIREHTDRMRARNYSQRYIRETAKSIRRSMKVLEQVGKLTMPPRLPRDALIIVRDSIPVGRNGGQRYRQYHTCIFRAFANRYGACLEPINYPDQVPSRPRITAEDYIAIRTAAYEAGDIPGAALMLYFGLTARRGAALKALPEDITPHSVLLRDKGRGGGKEREVPITPTEYAEFRQYLGWRQQEIMRVLGNNPDARIPKNLFIQARVKTMSDMCKTKMDDIIHACGRRVGIHLTSHMIRRMACLELMMACEATGKPIEYAMRISGHNDPRTFMMYCGAMQEQTAELRRSVVGTREKAIIRNRILSV